MTQRDLAAALGLDRADLGGAPPSGLLLAKLGHSQETRWRQESPATQRLRAFLLARGAKSRHRGGGAHKEQGSRCRRDPSENRGCLEGVAPLTYSRIVSPWETRAHRGQKRAQTSSSNPALRIKSMLR
jgi:hypothetical protein